MDLIYMNKSMEDVGILKDYTFDLAFGSDENNFECVVTSKNHCCQAGFFLYIEGTEYGGIVDSIKIDTEAEEIVYQGRTWHGMLASKILEPNPGEDYLILSGDANAVLATLIARMGLQDLFRASSEDMGLVLANYKMSRYIDGYSGVKKMLKSIGAKLNVKYNNGFVELSAKPLVDYSQDEQFDTDQIDFVIQQNHNHINHIICLGGGDLAERTVVHLYADAEGNISTEQTFTGLDEVTEVYEYASAESEDDLIQGGTEKLQESWNSNEVNFNFNSDEKSYDIGDIIGAVEKSTGIEVKADVTKKIVTIKDNTTTISYKVGE